MIQNSDEKDPDKFNTFDEAYVWYKRLGLSFSFTQGLAWASMKADKLVALDAPELQEYWGLYNSNAFEVAYG